MNVVHCTVTGTIASMYVCTYVCPSDPNNSGRINAKMTVMIP